LHANCLAALSNQAAHISDLHPAAAERLFSLLRALHRQYGKRTRELRVQHMIREKEAATGQPLVMDSSIMMAAGVMPRRFTDEEVTRPFFDTI
jgi:hypothetical protein